MSVAFRRDSDEEHLEPKFELPIPAGPNLVTSRGILLIQQRVSELESMLRAADETTAPVVERDLRYWQVRKTTAELAPVPSGDRVEFGVRVTICLNGRPKTFLLVGDDEAEPAAGLISFKAPLSQAMLGAEVGETLPFGGEEDVLQILSIEVSPEPAEGNNSPRRPPSFG